MKVMNGTFLFKTKEQLLSSGWKLIDGQLSHSTTAPVVTPEMVAHFSGKFVEVKNGKAYTKNDYWYICPEMILSEGDIVSEILTKYSNIDSE